MQNDKDMTELRAAVADLSAARAVHGHAMRRERRAAVDFFRECIAVALPVIAADAGEMLLEYGEAPGSKPNRGFLILDRTENERYQSGYDEGETENGWQVYVRPDGTLVELYARQHRGRFDDYWDRAADKKRNIGLRQAVRIYGGDALVRGLIDATRKSAENHRERGHALTEQAQRFSEGLDTLRRRAG